MSQQDAPRSGQGQEPGRQQPGGQPSPGQGGQHQQQHGGPTRQPGDAGPDGRRETTLDDDSGATTPR